MHSVDPSLSQKPVARSIIPGQQQGPSGASVGVVAAQANTSPIARFARWDQDWIRGTDHQTEEESDAHWHGTSRAIDSLVPLLRSLRSSGARHSSRNVPGERFRLAAAIRTKGQWHVPTLKDNLRLFTPSCLIGSTRWWLTPDPGAGCAAVHRWAACLMRASVRGSTRLQILSANLGRDRRCLQVRRRMFAGRYIYENVEATRAREAIISFSFSFCTVLSLFQIDIRF